MCVTTKTSGGADDGEPCIFPWYFNDEPTLYTGCASPDSDGPWCPTQLTTDGKYISGIGKWGYCDFRLPACNRDLDHSNCVTEQDTAYRGNDMIDGYKNTQPDVDSCRSSCHAILAPYFSYHPTSTKYCYCKSTDAGRLFLEHAVSGTTACAGKNICSASCLLSIIRLPI